MSIPPAVLLLVLLVGGSLGVLGSGGSILLIPVLVYAGGVPAGEAVPLSLAVVGATSGFGAWLHYRAGNHHARAALLFASSGSLGAVAGSRWTDRVPGFVLMLLLGILMLAVALSMVRRPREVRSARSCQVLRCLGVGAAVGILTGFLGVGGGFMLVPAMVSFGGVTLRRAIGASLTVIAINAAAGLAGHLGAGADAADAIVPLLVAAFLGMWFGVRLAHRLDPLALRRAFATLVTAVGISVILATVLGFGNNP